MEINNEAFNKYRYIIISMLLLFFLAYQYGKDAANRHNRYEAKEMEKQIQQKVNLLYFKLYACFPAPSIF